MKLSNLYRILLILFFALAGFLNVFGGEDSGKTSPDLAATVSEILGIKPSSINVEKTESDVILQRFKKLGKCGSIVELLLKEAGRLNEPTYMTASGLYILLSWNREEDGMLVEFGLMIGFDQEWRPLNVTVTRKQRKVAIHPASKSEPLRSGKPLFTDQLDNGK